MVKGWADEIQSATLEVISHRDQDQSAELQLSSLVIRMAQYFVIDVNAALSDSVQQGHEARFERGKHWLEAGYGCARFIDIQQGVVGRIVIPEILGFFPLELQHRPEVRQKHRECILFFRLRPHLLGQRRFAAQLHDEIRGQFLRAAEIPPHFAQERA